ncbi:MAG: replicative DNA helicase [Clostridia bacterium]
MENNVNNIPADLEAEKAVLGAMIIDSDAIVAATEKLKDDDFYREDHRQVYKAMMDLYSLGRKIDPITLKEQLKLNNCLDKVGGIEYITSLVDALPTTSNINEYVKIVEEKATLRKLIKASNDIHSLCSLQTTETDSVVEQAEKKIFDLLQSRKSTGYVDMKEGLKLSLENLEELCNREGNVSGLESGFIDVDEKTSGLNSSNLVIVGARPAMGKTAFALNIALHVAMTQNVPVLIFSLEMATKEIINRFISSYSEIDAGKIKNGKLEDADWAKISKATGVISELPIYISDSPELTSTTLRAQARKAKLEKNIGLIVIDYIQLMNGNGKSEGRQQEISEISRSLKILAKELKIPIIALTQLNRCSEKRDEHRPTLSDIRESGSIEQDADQVLFIHRESYYKEVPENKNLAEVIIAKNRSGSTGTIELGWYGQFTKFKNLYKGVEPVEAKY